MIPQNTHIQATRYPKSSSWTIGRQYLSITKCNNRSLNSQNYFLVIKTCAWLKEPVSNIEDIFSKNSTLFHSNSEKGILSNHTAMQMSMVKSHFQSNSPYAFKTMATVKVTGVYRFPPKLDISINASQNDSTSGPIFTWNTLSPQAGKPYVIRQVVYWNRRLSFIHNYLPYYS